MQVCLPIDRNLEFKLYHGRKSIQIFCCKFNNFVSLKKKKGKDVKGKAKWEELQTTHTSPGTKPNKRKWYCNPIHEKGSSHAFCLHFMKACILITLRTTHSYCTSYSFYVSNKRIRLQTQLSSAA